MKWFHWIVFLRPKNHTLLPDISHSLSYSSEYSLERHIFGWKQPQQKCFAELVNYLFFFSIK